MSRHISMVFYTAIRDHDLIKADDVNVSHLVWAKSGQRKTGKTKSKPVTRVRKDEEEEESSDSNELLHLRSKETSKSPPIMVEVKVGRLPHKHGGGHGCFCFTDVLLHFTGLCPGRA